MSPHRKRAKSIASRCPGVFSKALCRLQKHVVPVKKGLGDKGVERRCLAAAHKRGRATSFAASTALRQLAVAKQAFKASESELAALRQKNGSTSGAASRHERNKKRLKVQLLVVRQERARNASAARLQKKSSALEQRQWQEMQKLRKSHDEALRKLLDRHLEARKALQQRSADKLRSKREEHARAARSYRKRLASDDPRHADKFRCCQGGSLGRSMCILRPRAGKHHYTLVHLHQFNCDGFGYANYRPHYFFSATKFSCTGLKVVLPTAEEIPITAHEGNLSYAWYDYLTDHDGKREDEVGMKTLRATRDRIFAILDREIELLGGDASRVFLGGTSQGGCVALHCALQYPRLLGGVVGIVGHLLSCTPVPAAKRHLPISLYNGRDDETMRWAWVRKTFRRLEDAGYDRLRMLCAPGVDHDTGIKEGEWLVDFLSQHIATQQPR